MSKTMAVGSGVVGLVTGLGGWVGPVLGLAAAAGLCLVGLLVRVVTRRSQVEPYERLRSIIAALRGPGDPPGGSRSGPGGG